MDISDPSAEAVIARAERIVYLEKWRVCEQRATQRLWSTRGVAWTPLFDHSPVIRIVAIDGIVIGRIRFHDHRWIAVGKHGDGPVLVRRRFSSALRALAHAARRR